MEALFAGPPFCRSPFTRPAFLPKAHCLAFFFLLWAICNPVSPHPCGMRGLHLPIPQALHQALPWPWASLPSHLLACHYWCLASQARLLRGACQTLQGKTWIVELIYCQIIVVIIFHGSFFFFTTREIETSAWQVVARCHGLVSEKPKVAFQTRGNLILQPKDSWVKSQTWLVVYNLAWGSPSCIWNLAVLQP